ncbi:ZIP family metal transporter [candidate division TA06 bacterium]|uniref:ZIP family metal transporter n=1 Tax=candidate division TA06 bacterium TaxID=2250710 RepID=A0A933I9C5_UNCT6|nr:ZIP family metal transporter [candidate division TA06 bacterium]
MMILTLIIAFSLLGSICSVGLAALFMLLKGKRLAFSVAGLIPYAIGTLLGAAFFGMIPHALHSLPSATVLPTVLAGIILFYVLEKFALWRHCHEQPCAHHTRAGAMILIGDSLHNFVDGVAIAVAFSGSIPLGIATSVAVIAHEVPQEVGDFAILLESGYSRSRALWFNLLSSLTAMLGAVMTYFLLPFVQSLVPYLLSVSAASFIYIALADLVPGRRATGGLRSLTWELPLIALGIGTIVVLRLSGAH